jgi:hypothetical protein
MGASSPPTSSATAMGSVLASGEEVFLPLGAGKSEGAKIRVRITREAIREASHAKRAVATISNLGLTAGPDLLTRLKNGWHPVRIAERHGPDALAEAGWGELMDEAASGLVAFAGGLLRIVLTPALVAVDVDGSVKGMAQQAAQALAGTLRRLAIRGNVVVDLPTLSNAAERRSAALSFDQVMDDSGITYERTAVNGYGLLQIIMRRERPSLLERVQLAPIESAALALLRHGERAQGNGPMTLSAHPAVASWLEARSQLTDELARRTGRPMVIKPTAGLALEAGHAQ